MTVGRPTHRLLSGLRTGKFVKTVDALTARFPAKWTWHAQAREWRSTVGTASRRAAMAPRYDGDDENYVTEFWFYPITGTPVRIW